MVLIFPLSYLLGQEKKRGPSHCLHPKLLEGVLSGFIWAINFGFKAQYQHRNRLQLSSGSLVIMDLYRTKNLKMGEIPRISLTDFSILLLFLSIKFPPLPNPDKFLRLLDGMMKNWRYQKMLKPLSKRGVFPPEGGLCVSCRIRKRFSIKKVFP